MDIKRRIKELAFYESKGKIKRQIENYLKKHIKPIPFRKGCGYMIKYLVETDKEKYFLRVANKLDERRINWIDKEYQHSYQERINHEWELINKLHNYNLTPAPVLRGKSYFLTEYVEGPLLSEVLQRNEFGEYQKLLIHTFTKLSYLYKNNIILTDVSPDNILIKDGKPFFIDFEIYSEAPEKERITHSLITFILKINNLLSEQGRQKILPLILQYAKNIDREAYNILSAAHGIESSNNLNSFVQSVLKTANERVKYVFLRNFEFLFGADKCEGDIDILIPREHVNKMDQILLCFGFKKNVCGNKEIKYTKFLEKSEQMIYFHIYVDNIYYHSLPIVRGNKLFERRRWINNFYIPSNEDFIIELSMHSIFRKYFKNKYKQIIAKLLKTNVDFSYIFLSIREAYSEGVAKDFISNLKNLNFCKLTSMRSRCFNALLRNYPSKTLTTLQSRINHLFLAMTKRFRTPKVIAFVGLDGAGKTTLIRGIARILDQNKINYKIVYMGRWHNKSEARVLLSKFARSKKTSHSLFRQLIWVFDMYYRYFKQIRFCKEKLILTDRYVYDLLILKNSSKLVRILLSIYPKPAQVIFLYNDYCILAERNSSNIETVIKESEILCKLLQSLKIRPIKIKTDNPTKNIRGVFKILFEN